MDEGSEKPELRSELGVESKDYWKIRHACLLSLWSGGTSYGRVYQTSASTITDRPGQR
ncbi:hypothetical protein Sjap_004994 [Stephania japonica]|uniref:Uncharacterized protein n=1 Tax=Stephania japonica TaxID=461633 RepID=A0AAP0PLF0_9MAGN